MCFVSCFLRSIIRHGEPGSARGRQLAVMQERLQRGQQQRRGELQGELPMLHAGAGRRPVGQAAGQDAEEDGVRRPLVLAGILSSPHSQWSRQPHLKARAIKLDLNYWEYDLLRIKPKSWSQGHGQIIK